MKRFSRCSLLLLLALGLGACSKSATPPAAVAAPAAMPAAAAIVGKPYPFSTSVVSGVALGPKAATVNFVQDGYQVRLASADEADTFKKNPSVYMAKITEAYKTARPYPLTTCLVMGDALDDTAYSFVYEGREIKFCCDSCMDDFEKDTPKYVKIWDDAAAAKAANPTQTAQAAATPAVPAKN
jgi:YHS domain-containing protein